MTKKTARLGILGGMGRPTKGCAFCGDPDDWTSSAEVNSACGKILAQGPKCLGRCTCGVGPMPRLFGK